MGAQDGPAGQQSAAGSPTCAPCSGSRLTAAHDEIPPLVVQNMPIMTKTLHSRRVNTIGSNENHDCRPPQARFLVETGAFAQQWATDESKALVSNDLDSKRLRKL